MFPAISLHVFLIVNKVLVWLTITSQSLHKQGSANACWIFAKNTLPHLVLQVSAKTPAPQIQLSQISLWSNQTPCSIHMYNTALRYYDVTADLFHSDCDCLEGNDASRSHLSLQHLQTTHQIQNSCRQPSACRLWRGVHDQWSVVCNLLGEIDEVSVSSVPSIFPG